MRLEEKLAALRREHKMTQAELAEAVALGITDGKNPMQLIPRYQAAIMAKRAAQR